MTISSYISIFNDWNLLKPSIWSVDDYVDEIVVVDGAYEWMAPAVRTTSQDPTRSTEEVYDVLAAFGKKVRVINGLWKNETQKRQAGYDACRGRYVLRNDADEVLFWNSEQFEQFVRSGQAVGQMEMPVYVAPGLIRATEGAAIERQSFLFDTNKISGLQHLSYLWLVLPPAERDTLVAPDPGLVFAQPVAFTAHLTHWRSPETSINRARFYVLNYIRSTGTLPWIKDYIYSDAAGFEGLFKAVSPESFRDILLGHHIVAGPPVMENQTILPSGRPPLEDRVFAMLYDDMISGLSRLNDDLRRRARAIANGVAYLIDASTNSSLAGLQDGDSIGFRLSTTVQSAEVKMTTLLRDATTQKTELEVQVRGEEIYFSVPRIIYDQSPLIRRTLALTVRFGGPDPVASFVSIV